MLASIPSPSANGFHIGPLFIHAYGLAYVVAVTAAVFITRVRWEAKGGDRELVYEVALWGFPAGLIGGRIYFLITSWNEVPPHWWGPFAIWKGGLGIWGGIALGTLVGLWRIRRAGAERRQGGDEEQDLEGFHTDLSVRGCGCVLFSRLRPGADPSRAPRPAPPIG